MFKLFIILVLSLLLGVKENGWSSTLFCSFQYIVGGGKGFGQYPSPFLVSPTHPQPFGAIHKPALRIVRIAVFIVKDSSRFIHI